MIEIPYFSNKTMLYEFLTKNKLALVSQKKAIMKRADALAFVVHQSNDKSYTDKSESIISLDATKLFVRSVINTTGIFDSHYDVHIKGLWKKSLQESKQNYLVQEHDFSFKGIISDEVEAYTKQMSFKSLGFDYEGDTEALIYDSILQQDTNPYMFGKYASGKVKNHSVGMQYVKLFLCINSPMYDEEFANWNKYIDQVTNIDDVEESGFFYAVTEAKNIEGSAVLRGSNQVTPTLITQEKSEPPISTLLHTEPSMDTRPELTELLKNLKINI